MKCRYFLHGEPDLAMKIEKPGFAAYLKKLGEAAGMEIHSFADMKDALTKTDGIL